MNRKILMTVDIGNTAIKAAIYAGEEAIASLVKFREDSQEETMGAIEGLIEAFGPEGICYCCVGEDSKGVLKVLEEKGIPLLVVGDSTPLPIGVDYDRSRLGVDRIAAAVGVSDSQEAVLIVDAGTAVTIDLVAGGRFLGGNISPGLKLRFRSLHAFTSRLPMVSVTGSLPAFGNDTVTAIRSGVIRGLAGEIASAFAEAKKRYPSLKLVLTGGDALLMAPVLRDYGLEPCLDAETVGRGLVRIFQSNF